MQQEYELSKASISKENTEATKFVVGENASAG